MRIPARKTNLFTATLLAIPLAVAGTGFTQEASSTAASVFGSPANSASTAPAAPAPASVPASNPAPASGQAGQGGSQAAAAGQNSNSAAALDYMFNRKPQDGSIAKQAAVSQAQDENKRRAAEALGLTRVQDPKVKARFERYLGMPEITPAELQAYAAQLAKVEDLLKKDQVFDAWKQLQILASFDKIDAGVSRELANRIESIWNTDQASNHINGSNQQLRDEVRKSDWSADTRADFMREQELNRSPSLRQNGSSNAKAQAKAIQAAQGDLPQGKAGGGNAAPPSMTGLEGKLRLTDEYLRSLESKAKIKLNELKIQKLFDSSKSDFAAYVGTLFGSHRHQHVILAADFYRRLFKEDNYPVDMANKVNASLEAIREVSNTVDAFNYALGRNELAGATDRLQEAFVASEFAPVVLAVGRASKDRIADFISRLSKMESLIEAHDFGSLECMIKETKNLSSDFDESKALAIVNAVKLESRLRLGKAKLAAQQGDLKLAMEEFQAAAEAWPSNPALEDSAGTFFDTQDVKSKTLAEFDRLVAEQNIRTIFEKQLAFAPAIHGDPKREEELKSALEKIKAAEIAYEKANLMRNAGDIFGAWETIEAAANDLPNDNKLNMLRAELSGKGAEFVANINKAKDAEARKELGYAVSCYAVAQRCYPASTIANAGLQRLSQQILNSGKTL